MNKEVRNYYRFKGYYDGSGCPKGIVIRCLTDEEVKNWRCSCVFERIPKENEDDNKADTGICRKDA